MKTQKFSKPAFVHVALATIVLSALACSKMQEADDKMDSANKQTAAAQEAEKKNVETSNQLKSKQAELEKQTAELKAEIEAKKAELAKTDSELKAQASALGQEKTTWENDRSARELEISEMTKSLQEKRQQLTETEEAITKNRQVIEEETKKLAEDQKAMDDKKAALQKEIADLASNTEKTKAEIQAETEKVQAQLTEVNSNLKALADKQTTLDKAAADLVAREVSVKQSGEELKVAESKHEENVKLARDLFLKAGQNDALTKVEQNKKMKFLVTITGRGDFGLIKKFRENSAKVNGAPIVHADLTPELKPTRAAEQKWVAQNGQLVDDRMLVDATAAEIRDLRDASNTQLKEMNDKGQRAALTAFWVSVRPVQKVRVGMSLTLIGSKSYGYKNRSTGKVVELNSVRRRDSKLMSLESVDLTNPGSYVFAGNEGRNCVKFDLDCIKALKSSQLLDAPQFIVPPGGRSNRPPVETTYREILSEMLKGSQTQMESDLDVFQNDKPIFGLGYSEDKGIGVRLNTDFIPKLRTIYFGEGFLGEDRFPVIERMELAYRVTLVDEVSNDTGNPIDTWRFLNSSYIQNIPVFNADSKRNEIEISLPIQSKTMVVTTSDFKNMHLSDYKVQTPKPTADAETLKAAESLKPTMLVRPEALHKKVVAYQDAMKKFVEEERIEKNKEFISRLKSNIGRTQVYSEELADKK